MARSQLALPPMTLSLTLPMPPSVNHQYATVGKRRVLSAPARRFHREVERVVERARRDGTLPHDVEDGLRGALLGVYLTFYFETPMRRDLDGGLKIALDALGRALAVDDRGVVDLHLTKRIDPLRPRLDVEIETIHDWSFDRSYVYLGGGAKDEAEDIGSDAVESGNVSGWVEDEPDDVGDADGDESHPGEAAAEAEHARVAAGVGRTERVEWARSR
ncbi:MAG: RusA family crossover junction endodeoxyribonuclease [Chloroflexota bacterium]|nr:RusA family crossover junction endodeoxyribonuclease [Chloroflexota bacterium]